MKHTEAYINLDVQDRHTAHIVPIKKGDIGRDIVIQLSDGGFPFEFTPDCYAVLTGNKPDGGILFNHCSIENGAIHYEVTEQTCNIVGVISAEIRIYGSDDSVITTAPFRIIVDGVILDGGSVESSNEFGALTRLISQTTEIDQTVSANETERIGSEESRALAEIARDQAEQERADAEEERGRTLREDYISAKNGQFIPELNEENPSLDNYIVPGLYTCASFANAARFADCPVQSGFRLEVETIYGYGEEINRIQQTIYGIRSSAIFRRVKMDEWSDWYTATAYADSIGDGLKAAILAHDGMIKSWALTSTIKAVLCQDGTLIFDGTGNFPAYDKDNPAPYASTEILSQVKRIIMDEHIIARNLNYAFSVIRNGEPDNTPCTTVARFDFQSGTVYMGFPSINFTHINMARITGKQRMDFTFVGRNGQSHQIVSIPSVLATPENIDALKTRLNAIFSASGSRPNCTLLLITDSTAVRDALYTAIGSIADDEYNNSQKHYRRNMSCICTDNLGIDGFPSYWSSQMKRAISEIVPYTGKCLHYVKTTADVWYNKNMTALAPYRNGGIPTIRRYRDIVDVDNDVYFNVNYVVRYKNKDGKWSDYINVPGSSILGQPISPALESLACGLSCSGFLSFLYWRYFSDNFGNPNVDRILQKKTWIGNDMPLIDISSDDLEPFDILAYGDYIDATTYDRYQGGHVAIYLGRDNDNNIRVLDMDTIGLGYGEWNVEALENRIIKYMRYDTGNYKSLQHGKIRHTSDS